MTFDLNNNLVGRFDIPFEWYTDVQQAKKYGYRLPWEFINFRGKTIYITALGINIGDYLPITPERLQRATQDINRAMIEFHKTYIKSAIPLDARIAFCSHHTEVRWLDKQIHKEHGKMFVKDVVASLSMILQAHKTPPEFWAIAGRAYEDAKAVVA